MKINKELLFSLYMDEVAAICNECDWKSDFGPEEIVCIIANIIENNPDVVEG